MIDSIRQEMKDLSNKIDGHIRGVPCNWNPIKIKLSSRDAFTVYEYMFYQGQITGGFTAFKEEVRFGKLTYAGIFGPIPIYIK